MSSVSTLTTSTSASDIRSPFPFALTCVTGAEFMAFRVISCCSCFGSTSDMEDPEIQRGGFLKYKRGHRTELSHHFVRNGILALEEQAPVLTEGEDAGWILSSLVSSMTLKVGQQCAERALTKLSVVCCNISSVMSGFGSERMPTRFWSNSITLGSKIH